MTTLPSTIPEFTANQNLTEGQRRGSDKTLRELFQATRVDVVALETRATTAEAHAAADGTSHANVVLNDTHRASDGTDHADVVTNTSDITALKARSGTVPVATAARVAGGTLSADGSEDFTLLGTNLLNGQTFASVTLGASLDIIAEEPGSPGNALSVEVVDTGGAGPATVAYAAGKLTIDLVGLTPDEDTIAALVNTSGAWTGIVRANSGGGAAFGTVAETSLTGGGTGAGLKVYAGGGLCAPAGATGAGATSTASFSDTGLITNPPALTGLTPALQATTDTAQLWAVSDGYATEPVGVVLA